MGEIKVLQTRCGYWPAEGLCERQGDCEGCPYATPCHSVRVCAYQGDTQKCGQDACTDCDGLFEHEVVAVLSTTVMPVDGTYKVETLKGSVIDLGGVPHYIGHPATQEIVERLGAVKAESNLFKGLQPGEAALAFSIAQGKSSRAKEGFTTPHQEVTIDDLVVRKITRLE